MRAVYGFGLQQAAFQLGAKLVSAESGFFAEFFDGYHRHILCRGGGIYAVGMCTMAAAVFHGKDERCSTLGGRTRLDGVFRRHTIESRNPGPGSPAADLFQVGCGAMIARV